MRRRCAVGFVVAAVVAGVVVAGASDSTASASGKVAARAGNLEILNPFLPDPPSPSVAAVYLTVRNVGGTADELLSVSSPRVSSSMLMTENDHGRSGTMTMIRRLTIPAHGQAVLAPGHDHAMLENPKRAFKIGQLVPVVLHFARAGMVTVQVPVVPLSEIVTGGTPRTGRSAPTTGTSSNMSKMPGM